MDSHLEIDQKNNLVEIPAATRRYPAPLRIAARIVSYLFHPLFIPVYLSLLIVQTQSFLFSSFSKTFRLIFVMRFVLIYLFFPLVSVLLMKALGFISSIQLKTQRDRIIPYVVCMIFYWWSWYVLHNQPEFSKESVILSLAIFLCSIGGLMANISIKISMHAMAAGVMVAFVIMLAFSQDSNFGFYISLAVLLTGMICTARLIDSNHTTGEIYWGLIVGAGSLLVAMEFS